MVFLELLDNKLNWTMFLRKLGPIGISKDLLYVVFFFFFAVFCWGSSICADDKIKSKKIQNVGSVIGTKPDLLRVRQEKRIRTKLNPVLLYEGLHLPSVSNL